VALGDLESLIACALPGKITHNEIGRDSGEDKKQVMVYPVAVQLDVVMDRAINRSIK